jgi:REP element-mobilizing transposase RayT
MNRSSKGTKVFQTDDLCSFFCDILKEACERFDFRIHGFALMPTHYHLLIESVHGNLSRAMSYLNGRFTQTANYERDADGSVFRGRFHNKVVTDPSHLRYLLPYLHLNPVRARLVMRVDQWHWSSHIYYSGRKAAPDWLTTGVLLKEYGGAEGYRMVLTEVRNGRRERPAEFDRVLFGGRRSSEMVVINQAEEPRATTPEDALKQVLQVTGAEKKELFREVLGRGGNPIRTLAAWWLVLRSGLINKEVGKTLNMSEVAVSRAISRVSQEVKENAGGVIAKWLSALKDCADKVASRSA